MDRQLHNLSGMRVMPLGLGDEDVVDSRHGGRDKILYGTHKFSILSASD